MTIQVSIWGRSVGVLAKTEQGMVFSYDPDFKRSGLEISPFNLPLDGKDIYLNERIWQETAGVPGVFYDSLPDRFGNNLLQSYLEEKGYTSNEIDVFVKLQYVQQRGMGALEYFPGIGVQDYKDKITLDEIKQISDLGTKQKEVLRTDIKSKESLLQILHIGTSAGGARAKALIAINKTTGEIRSGQLNWGSDYGYFLLKVDGANQDQLNEPSGYGRLEFTYCQMATACGIDMMPSSLFQKDHFMTKRFDRTDSGEKVHLHSLCGLLGLDYNAVGTYSYDHYFMAARKLGLQADTMEEIYRRMVFNVLAKNCDDHTKNFAFLMDQSGEWHLSPAYDLCYSYNSGNEWVRGHNMKINGKRDDITAQDLDVIGKRYNLKRRRTIFNQVKSVIDDFRNYANQNGVKLELINEVEKSRPRISW